MSRDGARARIARLVPASLALGIACSACALVLGIDDPPLRPEDAGADAADAADAGADCAPDPKQGCRGCAVHDFCDDFDDQDAALFGGWFSIIGANPNRKGADSGIERDQAGLSPPSAITTHATGTSTSSYAFALNALDIGVLRPGRQAAGVKYAFYMSLEELALNDNAGPLPDAGAAYVGAILRLLQLDGGKPAPAGAALLVASDGVYLTIAQDILGGNDDTVFSKLFDGNVKSLSANWVRVEIVVADRDRAVAAGYSSCTAIASGTVAAAQIGLPTYQACLELPAAFGGTSWTGQPTIGAGGGTFGDGTLRVRHDNVSVDFME